MPKPVSPRKTPFSQRREREFLYRREVDALVAALEYTRSPELARLTCLLVMRPVDSVRASAYPSILTSRRAVQTLKIPGVGLPEVFVGGIL